MRKFNKNKALNKLNKNRNKNNIKKISIVFSTILLVGAILYFSFARFESTASFNLISGTIVNKTVLLSDKMITLKSKGSTDLEYDGVETLGVNGTEDNNLRYVGANPNNYIYFNCSTTNPSEMNDSTCEKWRIIGLFNNIEDNSGNVSSRVKIMRDESLGNYSWDSSDSTVNGGYGINQWGPSENYEGADLMRELNTDYLGNITVGTDSKWYNGSNNSKTANMPSKTLSSNAQAMIQEVKWNTGSNESNETSTWTTKNMYTYERSENTGKICSSGTYCNDSEIRTTSWIGKVALMYPSDYGYSTMGGTTTNKETCLNTSLYSWNGSGVSDCKKNSWIYKSGSYQWTLSPRARSTYAYDVFLVYSVGNVYRYSADDADGVRPAVFLQSSVFISGGNGSSSSPYKLEYNPPTISEKMISLANNRSTDLEYDGVETLGENGTEDNNLRYVGANPNNYVYFNCSTTNPSEMNDSTCEKWRIIGLFNNIEDNNGNIASRVKIIRDESLGKYSWDSSESVNNGDGINQWGPSGAYEGADLMRGLNTDYLGNITVGTDGKWYYGAFNIKTANMPTSTLNSNAQAMIQEVKWNTGTNGSNETSTWTTKNMYTYERSENTGKICSTGTFCNDSEIRTTSWIGKVALMYPSDYGYATVGGTTTNKETCLNTTLYKWRDSGVSDCKNNSWIYKSGSYQWTLSPHASSGRAYEVFAVSSDGRVLNAGACGADAVRPAVFLKSSITIAEGNGSSEMPYKLQII